MQCPIGNAAPGHALGEVEVVKLSQADGGSGEQTSLLLEGHPLLAPAAHKSSSAGGVWEPRRIPGLHCTSTNGRVSPQDGLPTSRRSRK